MFVSICILNAIFHFYLNKFCYQSLLEKLCKVNVCPGFCKIDYLILRGVIRIIQNVRSRIIGLMA